MIEKYFDEPILKLHGYEYSLDEQEDLRDWFKEGDMKPSEMSEREEVFYWYVMENG